MNKVFPLIIFSLFFLSHYTNGQGVLLEQKPGESPVNNFGPNKAWFAQSTYSFGTLFGKGDPGLSYNNWRSTDIKAGFKFKRKINGLLSVWLEPLYHYAAYNVSQSGPKITDTLFWSNTPVNHEKEHFATEGVLIDGFVRLNFDPKRGNFLGYYIDLGAGADIIIDREYLAADKKADGSVATLSISNIPFMNKSGYNCFARIGINWIALTFNYRLSNVFKSQYNIPEPSMFTAGIEFNPYSH